MILAVTLDGDTRTVDVDTAALSWAERCTGSSVQDIGEASLQMACAYYYVQHGQGPDAVDWDVIHLWGATHKISTTVS